MRSIDDGPNRRSKYLMGIIIPTFNSFDRKQGSLKYVIAALNTQSCRDFQTIVVDDASTDDSFDFYKSLLECELNFPLTMLRLEKHTANRSRTRNIGAWAAESQYLLFMDDDVILPDKHTLRILTEVLEPNSFLCGARRFWTYPTCRSKDLQRLASGKLPCDIDSVAFVPHGVNPKTGMRDLKEFSFISNFGLVSTSVFWRVGGFDEAFGSWGWEDTDLMLRLLLNGVKFKSIYEEISVVHVTHPVGINNSKRTEQSLLRYQKKCRKLGVMLRTNHLFGVFEGDDRGIFKKDW